MQKELLMELLFEIIFEIIFEGAFETATSESRRVPLPLRILCMLIVVAVFGGILALMIFCGAVLWRDGEFLLSALMFVLTAGIAGVLIWRFVKTSRSRK